MKLVGYERMEVSTLIISKYTVATGSYETA
jgi:hypothetical protein